ncbi:alanine/ornithine racemase family PLP-dependent enzyme [Fuchsiella alkaliacetigena]|uniref:alanine/ornithine racemase family PLP-dependent enzyme n=1 Tax=Fuchsiella alkaliacetigena TaxID=957042 RepID=UPI00200B1EEB|nr:alanine/ornithine racemase family PLP-dependent enzyme [Fuchsiella alkaliacetigena]MCK8824750.1 alanine/ornithine racemase family PLP-dependent enzyme [Fuchsiella alkaliacetigena]
MFNPRIEINIKKLISNTKQIVGLAAQQKVEIIGVTKGVCADLRVAQAMLTGGVKGLADSRLQNLRYLRKNLKLTTESLLLLRIPMLSEAKAVVEQADISLNSELKVIAALNEAAAKLGKKHKVILMVDIGDRREGVMPAKLLSVVKELKNFAYIELLGLGSNLACYGGVLPSAKNMQALVNFSRSAEKELERALPLISGGNSSSLPQLKKGELLAEINQLRIGETILLGRNIVDDTPFGDTYQDAFLLSAEVIELKEKGAEPRGERGENAFGEQQEIKKRGVRKRAILAVGRQDIDVEGLIPLQEGVKVEGASSDHLLLDVSDYVSQLKIGDVLKFQLNYSALLRAMTSPYVNKIYC